MTFVSAGHIILTPTQPVGSGRPQRESSPGLPHQESRALPTELPRPLTNERDRDRRQIGGWIKTEIGREMGKENRGRGRNDERVDTEGSRPKRGGEVLRKKVFEGIIRTSDKK